MIHFLAARFNVNKKRHAPSKEVWTCHGNFSAVLAHSCHMKMLACTQFCRCFVPQRYSPSGYIKIFHQNALPEEAADPGQIGDAQTEAYLSCKKDIVHLKPLGPHQLGACRHLLLRQFAQHFALRRRQLSLPDFFLKFLWIICSPG